MAKLKRIQRNIIFPAQVDCREWLDFIAVVAPEIEELVQNRLGLSHYNPKTKSVSLPIKKNYQKIAC